MCVGSNAEQQKTVYTARAACCGVIGIGPVSVAGKILKGIKRAHRTRSELIGIDMGMYVEYHKSQNPPTDGSCRFGLFVVVEYLENNVIQCIGVDIVLAVITAGRHCAGHGIRFHFGHSADIVRNKKRELRGGNVGNGIFFCDTVE